ncbi:SMI1/KNR4 family protein [Kibdelosporangium philippinense]|uniref:SMI1/KNR4 family protein n=1 Tax=Kibdelosporangium philippinense TaxID=211113 RepID=A0ABS8ZUY3_9PSEU|nr:SMI1/KNR4 family protein [Kibdelosporangium philippinense]MCE7010233.1 SMI1/KNR4 family protein [Kibdelosporangium philippinense]
MADYREIVDRIALVVGWTDSVSPAFDWATVEHDLGFQFPGDYKEFMARFPSGQFRNSIELYNPVQDVGSLAEFKRHFERKLNALRVVREGREDDMHPPFPEPDGVVPFADDAEGGTLFWVPRSPNPDEWSVEHQARGNPAEWTRTKPTMTGVLLELVTSRGERNIMHWDVSRHPGFLPY